MFQELSSDIETANPLEFPEYEQKLAAAAQKTGVKEAVVSGLCKVDGHEVVLAVMDFRFIGGSMGSVVGEKIMRAMLVGAEKKLPVIVFTSSGGARMQEGILSLMQMAKTAVATQALEKARCPYFVILTDPTTAGVLASFAMLGDVTLAEPGALMRFAGARVVAGTIREKVPENFPLSQYHYERGFIDLMVPRPELKKTPRFPAQDARGPEGGQDMSDNLIRDKILELKGLAEKSSVDISREIRELEMKLQVPRSRKTRHGAAWSWRAIPSAPRRSSTRR